MKILINESKLKEFIKDKLGVDLEGKIKMITSYEELPNIFKKIINRVSLNHYLNNYGPMYVIHVNDNMFLYQKHRHGIVIVDEFDGIIPESRFLKQIGLKHNIIPIEDLIELFMPR